MQAYLAMRRISDLSLVGMIIMSLMPVCLVLLSGQHAFDCRAEVPLE